MRLFSDILSEPRAAINPSAVALPPQNPTVPAYRSEPQTGVHAIFSGTPVLPGQATRSRSSGLGSFPTIRASGRWHRA